MKKSSPFIFFILVFAFFFIPKTIFAQNEGLFFCAPGPNGNCIVDVGNSDYTCDYDSGSPNQDYCQTFTNDQCQNEGEIVGYCQECNTPFECFTGSCPQDYTEISSPGNSPHCANPQAYCCAAPNITPPPPDICYECIIEPFGGNYCAARAPITSGTCDPFFTYEGDCNANCGSPQSWSCAQEPGNNYCTPAENGPYTGNNAYNDCLAACEFPAGDCSINYFGQQINGICDFLACPSDEYYNAGTKPIDSIFNLGNFVNYCPQYGYSCCILKNDYPITPIAALDPQEGCDPGSINTAFGCVQVSPLVTVMFQIVSVAYAQTPTPPNPASGGLNNFVAFYLQFAVGMAGGLALMLMIYSGILLLLSAGDPEKKKVARDYFVSALTGLLLVLFAAYLLEFIGIKILHLPGF